MVNCAWIGCSNNSRKGSSKDISFFKFPLDKDLRKKWEINTKRVFPPNDTIIRHLCHNHFHVSQFKLAACPEFLTSIGFASNTRRRRELIEGAVPKKFVLPSSNLGKRDRDVMVKRRHQETLISLGIEPTPSKAKKRKTRTLSPATSPSHQAPATPLCMPAPPLVSPLSLAPQPNTVPSVGGVVPCVARPLSPAPPQFHQPSATPSSSISFYNDRNHVHLIDSSPESADHYLSSPQKKDSSTPPVSPSCAFVWDHTYCMSFKAREMAEKGTQTSNEMRDEEVQVSPEQFQVACQTYHIRELKVAEESPKMSPVAKACDSSTSTGEDESFESESSFDDRGDPTFPSPVKKQRIYPSPYTTVPRGGKKFIVYATCLDTLFEKCRECRGTLATKKRVSGTFLHITGKCRKGHVTEWQSQPVHRRMPVGNLEMAGALFYSGSRFAALRHVMEAADVAFISESYYQRMQRAYLEPAVERIWASHQQQLLEEVKTKSQLIVGGDARCDSPGHSAKYGSYSIMDLETNKVLEIQLVQSNEVANSNAMELEGLKRCLKTFQEKEINVTDIVTDRHIQVKAFLKRESITHWFDVWHMAKGVKKKLVAAGKKKLTAELLDWKNSINNHIYWCVRSSNGDPNIVIAKWIVTDHVTNQHIHDNDLYPACQHAPIADSDRAWIKPGSRSHKALLDICCNKSLVTDLAKGSPHRQTSTLEAFHKIIAGFAPKFHHFFYRNMKCRILLAALHFNENANRPQAVTKNGKLRFDIVYPKGRDGAAVAVPLKKKPTFEYVKKLMREVRTLRQLYLSIPIARKVLSKDNPAPLASSAKRERKELVISRRFSRFNK